MNPVHFFEKCNCGDYKALFHSPSLDLYFYFQGVEDGEQCVFADSKLESFAFSTVDSSGNVLTPDTALFPDFYGWPEIDECTPDTLVIQWEDNAEPDFYDCTDFVSVPLPEFSANHYPA